MEQTIATFIQSETSHSLGVDIFLTRLPSNTEEGIVVRLDKLFANEINFFQREVSLLIMYEDYVVGYNNFEELIETFNDKRGTLDGSWTVSSEVIGEYLGLDKNYDRHAFEISFEVSHEHTST